MTETPPQPSDEEIGKVVEATLKSVAGNPFIKPILEGQKGAPLPEHPANAGVVVSEDVKLEMRGINNALLLIIESLGASYQEITNKQKEIAHSIDLIRRVLKRASPKLAEAIEREEERSPEPTKAGDEGEPAKSKARRE
jgi:hypothetical protein